MILAREVVLPTTQYPSADITPAEFERFVVTLRTAIRSSENSCRFCTTKLRSVGAQKAAIIATAPHQRGALEYAKTHGIALATIIEGRFTLETKSVGHAPTMSREQATKRYGLTEFIGHVYEPGDSPTRPE